MKTLSVFGVTSRLTPIASFGLIVATSAEAMASAPLPQPDGITAKVRMGCGRVWLSLMVPAWPEEPFAKHAAARDRTEVFAPTGTNNQSVLARMSSPPPRWD